jgi:hypothetical protein
MEVARCKLKVTGCEFSGSIGAKSHSAHYTLSFLGRQFASGAIFCFAGQFNI